MIFSLGTSMLLDIDIDKYRSSHNSSTTTAGSISLITFFTNVALPALPCETPMMMMMCLC